MDQDFNSARDNLAPLEDEIILSSGVKIPRGLAEDIFHNLRVATERYTTAHFRQIVRFYMYARLQENGQQGNHSVMPAGFDEIFLETNMVVPGTGGTPKDPWVKSPVISLLTAQVHPLVGYIIGHYFRVDEIYSDSALDYATNTGPESQMYYYSDTDNHVYLYSPIKLDGNDGFRKVTIPSQFNDPELLQKTPSTRRRWRPPEENCL